MMGSMFFCSLFALLTVSILQATKAQSPEQRKKLYQDLCVDMSKVMKDRPSMATIKETEPSEGFNVILGTQKTRECWAGMAKPNEEFKADSEYEKLCAKYNCKNETGMSGQMIGFGAGVQTTCTETPKGGFDCKFKVGPHDGSLMAYYTHADTKAKIYVMVVCILRGSWAGWFSLSAGTSFTSEQSTMIMNHVTSLGFQSNTTVTLHGDKCMK